ncbi:Homeobox [Metarhizium guizhouense ARSEF 977]|uniref:Homeobox n=1 Tax=Metarhizium guizhouense (strain ARSEF 977) TaxID=1276136 RepID=A0A0B4HSM6_METGA|nr:Homeobox [Metarhizium guizhouense ARSEF 977]
MNTGSKQLGTISRDSLATELFSHPRLSEVSSRYRLQDDQTPGTELSKSDRNGGREWLSQDADFDVDKWNDNNTNRDSDCHCQAVAERRAVRLKVKRFRLTNQQTRFLMSEFVKQPHPDAAHRERLSLEIPGLSPRQVQVWFQNR